MNDLKLDLTIISMECDLSLIIVLLPLSDNRNLTILTKNRKRSHTQRSPGKPRCGRSLQTPTKNCRTDKLDHTLGSGSRSNVRPATTNSPFCRNNPEKKQQQQWHSWTTSTALSSASTTTPSRRPPTRPSPPPRPRTSCNSAAR